MKKKIKRFDQNFSIESSIISNCENKSYIYIVQFIIQYIIYNY